ncbi:hypothetical protein PDESU_00081 [Pontiella desulfatans]|uniref:Uncharacterized protein n=1 Tax=Pontiella desulfatans TaxID=2750659 RepID=A0A6C2TVH3_PONDE|nr:hypothetical protein [Pontiella desulfatans]VGO11537.1 hypothetical protein PDESU_00081 [Pontiella desulfatans]
MKIEWCRVAGRTVSLMTAISLIMTITGCGDDDSSGNNGEVSLELRTGEIVASIGTVSSGNLTVYGTSPTGGPFNFSVDISSATGDSLPQFVQCNSQTPNSWVSNTSTAEGGLNSLNEGSSITIEFYSGSSTAAGATISGRITGKLYSVDGSYGRQYDFTFNVTAQ